MNSYVDRYVICPLGSFLAGFVLMAFEILSARMIAPLVGSSLYSWASVIGVTLLGLSLGSWVGGALADTSNVSKVLVRILLASSFLLGLTPLIATYLGHIEVPGGIIFSSLVYSFVLFFPASFTLGAIQPLILKEYAVSYEKIGKTYGFLSMLWSLGSILGVLAVGFVLISFFSVMTIVFILSAVCFLYALLFARQKKIIKVFLLEIVLVAISVLLFFGYHYHQKDGVAIFEKDTPYYRIKIVDFVYPHFGFTRSLFLDYDQHSSETQKLLPYAYTNSFPLFGLLKENPKKILVLGGGAYTLPKKLSTYYKTNVDVFEIDPALPSVVEKYFGYSTSSITTTVGEARMLLKQSDRRYDLIFGDTYNSFISIPPHMATKEYYELTKQHLSPGGIYAMSFASPEIGGSRKFLKNMAATFTSVYPNFYIFSFTVNKNELGSILLVGINSPTENHVGEEDLRKKIRSLGEYSFLEGFLMKPYSLDTSAATIFTDNYVPVENQMESIMSEYFKRYSSFLFGVHNQEKAFYGVVENNDLVFKAYQNSKQ